MILFRPHGDEQHDQLALPLGRQRTSVWDRDPDKVLDYWQATRDERSAVNRAAKAMLEFERECECRRPAQRIPKGTGYDVLNELDVGTARWAALATAAIYRAEQIRGYPCVLQYQRRRRATTMARWRARQKGRAA